MTSVNGATNCFRDEELNNCFKMIYIHSMDYDRYIETNRENNNLSEKHILYIDTGLFLLNYDAVREGSMKEIRDYADEFFNQIETLFNRLSTYYNLPIVISGHPHSKYPKEAYGGRKIIYNRTAQLAKDAKIIIVIDSTATSFAALYDKPLIHIVNKRLMTPFEPDSTLFWFDYIRLKASLIEGVGFLDMDNEQNMLHPWAFAKNLIH